MNSWRDSTKCQYDSYTKQFCVFCKRIKVNPLKATVSQGLEFLHSLHVRGLSYSSINTARSAISSFLSIGSRKIEFGSHKLVCQYMKGIFNLKPSLPRYTSIWDPNKVLKRLSRQQPRRKVSLKVLTLKVVVLLSLLSVQRIQTLHAIRLENVSFTDDFVQIVISEPLKTSTTSRHLEPLMFKKFDANKRLCIYRYLHEYIERTRSLRGAETSLFVSYQKPHAKVSKDTISRWIRIVLCQSGINIGRFKAHSTRAASASKAANFVSMNRVLRAGGWSTDSTFRKHYKLPTIHISVQTAVLQNV